MVDNSYHRPGYRLSTKLLHDAEARDALDAAYGEAEQRMVNAWKTPAPGPITADATDGTLDSEWDDADPYGSYDRRIQDLWKSE